MEQYNYSKRIGFEIAREGGGGVNLGPRHREGEVTS